MTTPSKTPSKTQVADAAFKGMAGDIEFVKLPGGPPSMTAFVKACKQVSSKSNATVETDSATFKAAVFAQLCENVRLHQETVKWQLDNKQNFVKLCMEHLAGVTGFVPSEWDPVKLTSAYVVSSGEHKTQEIPTGIALDRLSGDVIILNRMVEIVTATIARESILMQSVQRLLGPLTPGGVAVLLKKAGIPTVRDHQQPVPTMEEADKIVTTKLTKHYVAACAFVDKQRKQDLVVVRAAIERAVTAVFADSAFAGMKISQSERHHLCRGLYKAVKGQKGTGSISGSQKKTSTEIDLHTVAVRPEATEVPVAQVPVEQVPVEQVPVEQVPVEQVLVEQVPASLIEIAPAVAPAVKLGNHTAAAPAEDNGTATDRLNGTPVTPWNDDPVYSSSSDPTTPRPPQRDGGRPKREASQSLDRSQERQPSVAYETWVAVDDANASDKPFVDEEFWGAQGEQCE